MRRPAWATFGRACSQVCRQVPPMTIRSPAPRSSARSPAARGRQQEAPPRAERDDGHDRVAARRSQPVAVEGGAVLAAAVRGERHPRERASVPRGERGLHRRQQRVPGPVVRPGGHESRHVDDAVVHSAALGLPAGGGPEHLEHGLVPLDPLRQVVDPGARAQIGAPQTSQGRVARRRLAEEARLIEHGGSGRRGHLLHGLTRRKPPRRPSLPAAAPRESGRMRATGSPPEEG